MNYSCQEEYDYYNQGSPDEYNPCCLCENGILKDGSKCDCGCHQPKEKAGD